MTLFLNVGFKQAISLSSPTLIKRFFSPFSLSAISMVSSAYLSLLIFLPEILIPVFYSSSLGFHMVYSAQKLNKQGDQYTALLYSFPNFEPVHGSMSGSNCYFRLIYRFLRRQVRWSGVPISLRVFHSLL